MGRMVNLSLLIILLVLVGSGLASFYAIFIGGRNVEVPSLEGRPVAEALDEIQRLGLLSRVDEIDSSLPKGAVISQWPEAGAEVRKGKVVLLKVSKGASRFLCLMCATSITKGRRNSSGRLALWWAMCLG